MSLFATLPYRIKDYFLTIEFYSQNSILFYQICKETSSNNIVKINFSGLFDSFLKASNVPSKNTNGCIRYNNILKKTMIEQGAL